MFLWSRRLYSSAGSHYSKRLVAHTEPAAQMCRVRRPQTTVKRLENCSAVPSKLGAASDALDSDSWCNESIEFDR
jgi:hypothetical protein